MTTRISSNKLDLSVLFNRTIARSEAWANGVDWAKGEALLLLALQEIYFLPRQGVCPPLETQVSGRACIRRSPIGMIRWRQIWCEAGHPSE